MFWGTKTEKELLRKNGLGKEVVIKELDKCVAACLVVLMDGWMDGCMDNVGQIRRALLDRVVVVVLFGFALL